MTQGFGLNLLNGTTFVYHGSSDVSLDQDTFQSLVTGEPMVVAAMVVADL